MFNYLHPIASTTCMHAAGSFSYTDEREPGVKTTISCTRDSNWGA